MLVYGDHQERIDPADRLSDLSALAGQVLGHDQLTRAFIDLAGVTQGVADADFAAERQDRLRPVERLLLDRLTCLAEVLLQSWDRGASGGCMPVISIPPQLPPAVTVKLAEGFAFYALRPEAFGLAARRLVLDAPPRVIGLRSIGTGLACVAAAALGAPPPFTLRPIGDPFARELNLSDDLAAALLDGDVHYIIVDEGPGLSGSSFGAVADWLEDHGIAPGRIAFLPGHAQPLGPQSSRRHRCRWESAQRPVVVLDQPRRAQVEALVGPAAELTDISGGAWRSLWSPAEDCWPAIDPTWERRKVLAHTRSGQWLVKFAGLGRTGEARLALARQVQAAGFGPEVAGLCDGWLVTRWNPEAVPTRPSPDELLRYLRFRRGLPAPSAGASPTELQAMVRRNLPDGARFLHDPPAVAPVPVCTDNRMAVHEWLRLPSGRLLKSDAVDHHQAHDLIGCQDIAWDLAGAMLELDLPPPVSEQLRAALEVDPALLRFMVAAYAAFRVGAHRLSASTLGHWPEEKHRHLAAADRMAQRLASIDAVQHSGHVH